MVSRMEPRKGLLDPLQEMVGCPYLSDLRRPDDREMIRRALRQLRPEDYTPAEWQDAACYLLSSESQSMLC